MQQSTIANAGGLLGPLFCLFLALPVAVPAMSQPSGGSTAGSGLIAPSGQPVGSLAPTSRPPGGRAPARTRRQLRLQRQSESVIDGWSAGL